MGISQRRSWTLEHDNNNSNATRRHHRTDSPYVASSWQKLRLLTWKNYKIQLRHRIQTVTEILLPLLFALVLLIVRNVVPSTLVTEPTVYRPLTIEGVPPGIVQSKCNQIYYTPNIPVLEELLEKVNQKYFAELGLPYNFTGFETEADLVNGYLQVAHDVVESGDLNVPVPVLAGIVFTNEFINGSFPKDIEYTLRFPATQRSDFSLFNERFGLKPAWFTELLFPLFQFLGPRSKDSIGGGLPGYHEEGFIYLQYALDRTLSREFLSSPQLEEYNKYDIKIQRFPYPPFIDDKFLFVLQTWLPLIMMLSTIYPAINITKGVTYEKETRLKEYMKMMGLSNWLHWTAWFLKSYFFLLISFLLLTAFLKIKVLPSQQLAILPQGDPTLLFFMFAVFAFSLIGFAFFISTLFSRATSAATCAGVLWFVIYVPYGLLRPRYNLLTRTNKLTYSFLSNVGISFACQLTCMFEGTGVGIQWSNLFEGSAPDDDFCLGDCIMMMFLNGVVYIILALYIEAVRPGEFGVPVPFYHPFMKIFHLFCGNSNSKVSDYNEDVEMNNPPSISDNIELIENEGNNVKPGVQIKGLTKVYDNGKMAVRNLTVNFNEGQITAFLGHNGAGKTTTLSILCGLYPPTSGTAYINNYDIRKDISSARSNLGLCPQYDILFDDLTVEEHLKFYCLLKGLHPLQVEKEVNRVLKSLGLENKRDALSCTLSGGMRRKVSVGIAFCANSKVVLLDEPSSGMDPGARRSIWDLIQNERKERTILISTHYMEEADILGDRIVIIANGELQTAGSSLFLKKKFGGGYHLIIVKKPECEIKKVTEIIRETIPEIEVEEDVGAELSYSLPDGKADFFPEMFEEIERRKEELGIASYGVGLTTMEEVFLRVNRRVESKLIQAEQNRNGKPNGPSVEVTMLNENQDNTSDKDNKGILYQQDEPPRNTGFALLVQQFRAMITKKLIYASRNRMLLVAQMGIPVVYLILILTVLKYLPGLSDPPPHKMRLERYEKISRTVTPIKCFDEDIVCQSYKEFIASSSLYGDVIPFEGNVSMQDYILMKGKEHLAMVNARYIIAFEQRKLDPNDSDYRQLIGYFNNQPFHGPPLTLNFISNAVLLPTNHSVSITNHPLPISSFEALKHAGSLYTAGFQIGMNIAFGMSFLAASFAVFLITERESKSKHIQFVSGMEFPLYWIAGFLVDLVQFIIPCVIMLGVLHVFGVEEFSSMHMKMLLFQLMICYGMAVIPMTYLLSYFFSIPTSGFSRLAFFNVFTGLATILTVTIIQIPEFDLQKIADFLNNIFLLFPNYALGMGIVQLSTNHQFAKDCVNFNLEFICPVLPDSVCCAKLKTNFLDWERVGIGKNVTFLIAAFFVYFIILFIMESKILSTLMNIMKLKAQRKESRTKTEKNETEDDTGLEDSDVLKEKKEIESSNLTELCKDNTLVVRNLTKYYDNFVAVDHINLKVKRGECFGLLGINGAGKTSTFKMLTGDLPISEGEAYVCSRNVRTEIKRVHEILGYCPQFDALIDEMTGRETIQLYARLRGIQESYIPHLTRVLGEILLFSQYLDKRVSSYSGGNKRKLSTAIALIGSPPIVFLDEMTTGMDPKSRRETWDVITKVMKLLGTSVILTSHSMDECEALCTRLAVMVNGTFRCLGSPQMLKNKFGEGYTLIAQTTPKAIIGDEEPLTREKQELGRRRSSISSFRRSKTPGGGWESELEDLRTYIETSFPGCSLKDIHPGFVHYQVPFSEATTWGTLFRKMEVAKHQFKLEAYSVGQCTLEQIFLAFTKAQINKED